MLSEQISHLQNIKYSHQRAGLGDQFIGLLREMFSKEVGRLLFTFPSKGGNFVSLKDNIGLPLNVIESVSGAGKTHLCVNIAKQSLQQQRFVTYVGFENELEVKTSILSAKMTALMSTYSNKVRLCDVKDITDICNGKMAFRTGEVLVLDNCVHLLSHKDIANLINLGKVLNLSIFVTCQSFRDLSSVIQDDASKCIEIGSIHSESELYAFIVKNVNAIFSWGRYSQFGIDLPVGQFSLRIMKKSLLTQIYIPEI